MITVIKEIDEINIGANTIVHQQLIIKYEDDSEIVPNIVYNNILWRDADIKGWDTTLMCKVRLYRPLGKALFL